MNRRAELFAHVPNRIPIRVGDMRQPLRGLTGHIDAAMAVADCPLDFLGHDFGRREEGDDGNWKISVANFDPVRQGIIVGADGLELELDILVLIVVSAWWIGEQNQLFVQPTITSRTSVPSYTPAATR